MSSTSTQAEIKPEASGARYLALTAMIFAVAMTFIDKTIVALAAPAIEQSLGISDSEVQWVINGYLLSLAALFALGGRLADVWGHKKVVLIGIVVFAASSAMCALTPTADYAATWLIGFRIIQGAGAALLFPAALAIVVAAFPLKGRGRALALFFAIGGGLTAVGPLAGGYLLNIHWSLIFWINIPFAIIGIILTLRMKINTEPLREPIDWRGGAVVATGMAVSIYGLQQAAVWGWSDPKTIGFIGVGALVLAFFVWLQARTEVPLIKVRIFKDRAFSADNAVLFFSMMTFIPVLFFLSLYAQVVLGESATQAGLFLMWFFVGFIVAAQVGGAMLDRSGAKLPMIIGCVLSAVGYGFWAWKTTDLNAGAITPYIVLAGAGIGFLLGPASTDAVNRSINASYGEVTGITQTVRNYGSAVGMAILGSVMGTIFKNDIVPSLRGLGLTQDQADLAATSFSGNSGGTSASGAIANYPPGVADKIQSIAQLDFARSLQAVFYSMAAIMVVALICALLHPGGKVELETGAAQEVEDEAPPQSNL